MKKAFILLTLGVCLVSNLPGENYLEMRATQSQYRYVNFDHLFKNQMMFDFVYVGVPEDNEVNVGIGYLIQPTDKLTIAPLLYANTTKEHPSLGFKPAMAVSYKTISWDTNLFGAFNADATGPRGNYLVIDPLEFNHKLGEHWWVGLSFGCLVQGEYRDFLAGPVLKRRDRGGWWSLTTRLGSVVEKSAKPATSIYELRISRAFDF